jgi:hypothetical protein
MSHPNETRAGYGANAIATSPDKNDPFTDTVDTLANIMHYCDGEGIDFTSCLFAAQIHFDAETDVLEEEWS